MSSPSPSSPDDRYLREAMDFVQHEDVVDKHTIVVSSAIDKSVIWRIRRLLDYEFPTRAIFSLTKVPAKADWDSQWFPPALAYDGFPLALRVVGSVVEVDVDGLRSLGGSASLALELMRDVDHDALVKLIQKGDSRSETFPEHMHLTQRVNGPAAGFSQVYDARGGLRPREKMPKLSILDVRKGDVVVAECVCERDGVEGQGAVSFDVLSVAILAQPGKG
ncbi:hypothetical protein VTO73DRAFT_6191 [Trametes versicolor]